jgi:hypothetical protein
MGSTFLGYNPIPLSVSKQMGSSRSQSGIVGSACSSSFPGLHLYIMYLILIRVVDALMYLAICAAMLVSSSNSKSTSSIVVSRIVSTLNLHTARTSMSFGC